MKLSITAFIIAFLLFAGAVSAQISTIKRTVNNKEFYVHTIEKGQTVYAITKIYGVTDKEIYENNPGTEQGIRAGAELLIPIKGSQSQTPVVDKKPTPENGQIKHIVSKGETLYGLSKQYGVTVDEILSINPSLAEGLKVGAEIKIPGPDRGDKPVVIKNETKEDIKVEEEVDLSDIKPITKGNGVDYVANFQNEADCLNKTIKKEKYRIALLLPFGFQAQMDNKQARVAFQFFAGAQLAQKMYPSQKVAMEWQVFSTGDTDDTSTVSKLINSGKLNDFDMIVGPLYAKSAAKVAEFASEIKKPILLPTVRGSEIIIGNPYVIKTTPSPEYYRKGLAEYMVNSFDNIILMNTPGSKDSLSMIELHKDIKSLISKYPGKKVHLIESGKSGAMELVIPQVENLIYFPRKNELAVGNFLTGMRKLKKTDKITVMGDESWLSFRNFDPEYYNTVKLQVPVIYFMSPEIVGVEEFVKEFRNTFKTDPEGYAFKGYDAVCYVTDMLEKYGSGIPDCISFESSKYTLSPFKMERISGGGFDNKGIQVLIVDEYKLKLTTN
ncbi:MAG: LysM peptidoglycan-binding domain-containing protein [Flavobacteriales bacterium]|nr:LysM peptidoglycan-binding domain-containing protein [Flavobacteriales bacterium]